MAKTQPPDIAARPKRLSLSQVVELLLTRGGDRSSVTLARTAAGETTIEVKVRTGDSDDIADADAASQRAQTVYDDLRERYPSSPRSDVADITLTRNAKGDVQVAVSADTTPGRGDTMAEVVEKACERFDATLRRYPLSSGYTHNPPAGGAGGAGDEAQ